MALRVMSERAEPLDVRACRDLADLYLLALEKAPAASIFNGAHGAAIPLIDIARAASESAGAEGRGPGVGMAVGRLGRTRQTGAWLAPVAAFDPT
jgi:nucleoside-diphosphate-sugar epimerase